MVQPAGASVGISRSPLAGTSKKVATMTVSPGPGLNAVWTSPCPRSTNAVPAGYARWSQVSPSTYTRVPWTTLTNTGPAWVCHGNWAPGCTVNRAVTVPDASLVLTTSVAPSVDNLTLRATSSVNTALPASTS